MIQDLLSRLHKVKATGRGTWLACCPAHDDDSPSLSLRETDDGVVLLHCFAGCSAGEVVGAAGLELDALFPPKPVDSAKPIRRPFPAADVLEAVSFECMVVAVHAADMATGKTLTDEEKARLWICFQRISDARKLANG